jgi:hypothetical protein
MRADHPPHTWTLGALRSESAVVVKDSPPEGRGTVRRRHLESFR